MKKLLTVGLCLVCLSTLISCTPKHRHALAHHEAVTASCTEEGCVEYWSCGECGLLFADEDAKVALTEQELTVAQTEHTDGDRNFRCDGCDTLCVTAEQLQGYLDTALGKEGAMVNEYHLPSASYTDYALADIATKFDLSIVSDFELSACYVGAFADREVVRYRNGSETMIGLVIDNETQKLEGVLIYDWFDNLTSMLVIHK